MNEITRKAEIEKIAKWLLKEFELKCSMESPAKKCALLTVRELMQEHSHFVFSQERWEFWRDVESFLNSL